LAPRDVHIAIFVGAPSNVVELQFAPVSENSSKHIDIKFSLSLSQKKKLLIKK